MKAGWSPLNTALMVLGFIVFWPLGLAILAYILWGDELRDMFYDARYQFRQRTSSGSQDSGNLAFDDYRQRELNRLEEERRRLDAMREEFDTYMRNLRRAKDQEEFDRFMNNRDSRGSTDASNGVPDGSPA